MGSETRGVTVANYYQKARRAERKAQLLRAEARAEKARARVLNAKTSVAKATAERDYYLAMSEVSKHRRAMKRRKRKDDGLFGLF